MGGRRGEVGEREVGGGMWEGGKFFVAEKRLEKINNFGQGGCVFGSSAKMA